MGREKLKEKMRDKLCDWANDTCDEWCGDIYIGNDTMDHMTDAAFAVFEAIMEAQITAVEDGNMQDLNSDYDEGNDGTEEVTPEEKKQNSVNDLLMKVLPELKKVISNAMEQGKKA